MSLYNTPSSERIHIGFFGKTNAGKSSLLNAVAGQKVSVTSDVKGTTTDPVKKSMELLPLGPVVLIDTPGLGDDSLLGEERQKRTEEILQQIHIAVLVADAANGKTDVEAELCERCKAAKIPYLMVYNKMDLLSEADIKIRKEDAAGDLYVSAKTGENIEVLKERIGSIKEKETPRKLVSDLLVEKDHVILVIPIDKAAPKGRLILPQQQTIRDILDAGCTLSICQPETLEETIKLLQRPPKLVITDSQVFSKVKDIVPRQIMLTSFSILFARYKGDLERNVKGAFEIEALEDNDTVLISEGCTHHRQCGDIGTQKLPDWICSYTGKKIRFEFTSGGDFPEDLSSYKLIVHCGACMLNEKQMQERIRRAKEQKKAITNYGITIAYLNGILKRSIEPLGMTD